MRKDNDVASVEELFAMAREMGGRIVACTVSMDVLGVMEKELIEHLRRPSERARARRPRVRELSRVGSLP